MAARKVAILGGGISGLSAAWELSKHVGSKISSVTLIEGSSRLGGKIESSIVPHNFTTKKSKGHGESLNHNYVLESGPRSLRPMGEAGKATIKLAYELGIPKDELLIVTSKSNPAAGVRYVYCHQQLNLLPSSPLKLLRDACFPSLANADSKLLPAVLLKGILKEPFSSLNNNKNNYLHQVDESVFHFIERKFGSDFANFMIDPLCLGIFSGNARSLSLGSCFPFLRDLDKNHPRSLIIGAILSQFENQKNNNNNNNNNNNHNNNNNDSIKLQEYLSLFQGAKIWSLQGGLGRLVDHLHDSLKQRPGVTLRVGHTCRELSSPLNHNNNNNHDKNNKIRVVSLDNNNNTKQEEDYDHVFSALPSSQLSKAMSSSFPETSSLLAQIPFADVVVVNLVFEGDVFPVRAFGYLVPTWEKQSVLGVVFDSCIFPAQDLIASSNHNSNNNNNNNNNNNQNNENKISRMTVMMGGHDFHRIFPSGLVDDKIAVGIALQAVRDQMNILSSPLYANVNWWQQGIPQYHVGHDATVKSIHDSIEDCSSLQGRLSLIGNSYRGIGVNDCILNSQRAVHNYLSSI